MPKPTDIKEEFTAESVAATSDSYVGRWNRLVSSTNWEKGRIIHEWREDLIEHAASASEYSDEAWSQRVRHVSAQHVGRLRRVWVRFGEVRAQYEGMFWSHFQAALDWDDAEMWLEGAVQNDWSVSQMHAQRVETLGLATADSPADASAEAFDEDVDPGLDAGVTGEMSEIHDVTDHDAADDAEADADDTAPWEEETAAEVAARELDADEPAAAVRPFENLATLPADLSEAMDSFKLAILRHKVSGWMDVSPNDVLAHLEALKELTLAP